MPFLWPVGPLESRVRGVTTLFLLLPARTLCQWVPTANAETDRSQNVVGRGRLCSATVAYVGGKMVPVQVRLTGEMIVGLVTDKRLVLCLQLGSDEVEEVVSSGARRSSKMISKGSSTSSGFHFPNSYGILAGNGGIVGPSNHSPASVPKRGSDRQWLEKESNMSPILVGPWSMDGGDMGRYGWTLAPDCCCRTVVAFVIGHREVVSGGG